MSLIVRCVLCKQQLDQDVARLVDRKLNIYVCLRCQVPSQYYFDY